MFKQIKIIFYVLIVGLVSCKTPKYILEESTINVCDEYCIDSIYTHKHTLIKVETVKILK